MQGLLRPRVRVRVRVYGSAIKVPCWQRPLFTVFLGTRLKRGLC